MNSFIFSNGFDSFEDLFDDTDLDNYVIRFYDEDGSAIFKMITGYTLLPNDILLHLVDTEGCDTLDEVLESMKEYGTSFRTLSSIAGRDGFDIIPFDQFDDDEWDDGECDGDCDHCRPVAANKETVEVVSREKLAKIFTPLGASPADIEEMYTEIAKEAVTMTPEQIAEGKDELDAFFTFLEGISGMAQMLGIKENFDNPFKNGLNGLKH